MITSEQWVKCFSATLKEKLMSKGITQRELSERAGITEAAISRYTRGARIPNAETILKIAKALGCSVDELTMFEKEE